MKDLSDALFVWHTDALESLPGYYWIITKSYIETVLKRYSIQDYKLRDSFVAKGDKFSLNQCLKNDYEEKRM